MPGFEYQHSVQPFHPSYLKNMQYYSTIRFMNWQRMNESRWADRVTPQSSEQTSGVCVEHMVTLSNLIGASPWFTMPYNANDDYVLQFATLVKNTLRRDVEVRRPF